MGDKERARKRKNARGKNKFRGTPRYPKKRRARVDELPVPIQTRTVQNIVENTPENVPRPPRAVHSQMPRPGSTTTQIADQNQSTVTPTVNPANPELNVPVTSSSAREEERPVVIFSSSPRAVNNSSSEIKIL